MADIIVKNGVATLQGVELSEEALAKALREVQAQKVTAASLHGTLRQYEEANGPYLQLDPARVRKALEYAEKGNGVVHIGASGEVGWDTLKPYSEMTERPFIGFKE